jgi:hypothetical protein
MTTMHEPMNEQEQDRFEAYYFGTMAYPDLLALEAEFASDNLLRMRYDAFVAVLSVIRGSRAEEQPDTHVLRARLKAIDSKMDAARPPAQWRWAVAAAALALLGIWWLLREPEHRQLAAEFSLPEPGLPVLMDSGHGRYDHIMNELKQGNLNGARAGIRYELGRVHHSDTLFYFAGITDALYGQWDSALVWFSRVPSSSSFAARARYQQAIGQLWMGNVEIARNTLRALPANAEPQVRDRAERLLDRLSE